MLLIALTQSLLRYSGLVCDDLSLVLEADSLNPSRECNNFSLPLFQTADLTSSIKVYQEAIQVPWSEGPVRDHFRLCCQ